MLYVAMKRYGEAVPLMDRVAREYAKRPELAGAVPVVRSELGVALLRDDKPAEAEPHLLAGYDGLTKRTKLSPANQNRLRGVTAGLAEVSERTGRPDRAIVWRWRLAKLPPEAAPPPRRAVTSSGPR